MRWNIIVLSTITFAFAAGCPLSPPLKGGDGDACSEDDDCTGGRKCSDDDTCYCPDNAECDPDPAEGEGEGEGEGECSDDTECLNGQVCTAGTCVADDGNGQTVIAEACLFYTGSLPHKLMINSFSAANGLIENQYPPEAFANESNSGSSICGTTLVGENGYIQMNDEVGNGIADYAAINGGAANLPCDTFRDFDHAEINGDTVSYTLYPHHCFRDSDNAPLDPRDCTDLTPSLTEGCDLVIDADEVL
ncbi:hypothetical protein A2856_03600 [Candidatus Uhrbacteria bacterium RIFCSPHIGHO2_01_FULL_63_20]|uniref:Uncharacterized protein n=1 Tax=Candidatus Uhrbacteria bacterium RIFCSPHIGHO2_01_FULL_63_20 TaxID=1802385 RepID=A0A1F7TMB0_9BACT|nr:MAG: hypothetical protein A2856_03600 [Candidatus Uhrbacteria bacterium RIFCSPHIGHO2_01_FULL_63_20]